ncbi:MAG: general secretion pathway protein GspB [Mariprofundaceae bacterium]
MSFILKALEKSEQERQQREAPKLFDKAIGSTKSQHTGSTPQWTIAITAVALAFMLGWFQPWNRADEEKASKQKKEPVVIQSQYFSQPNNETPVKNIQRTEPRPPITQHQVGMPAASIQALPESLRQTLPTIHISAHIFAEKPDARLVMVNTQAMHEGDRISKELSIKEITQKGVVFQYQQHFFYMKVFEQWNE